MKKLLGIRTVYDIDPTKTFRIADILEAGAILPRSVPISEVMVEDLEQPEQCRCIDYAGDDPKCPVHGQEPKKQICFCGTELVNGCCNNPACEYNDKAEGSDTSTMTQLQDAGYGCGGIF